MVQIDPDSIIILVPSPITETDEAGIFFTNHERWLAPPPTSKPE